jgi:tetrahydromethanopterin S-methyltransferase subunit G
MEVFLMDENIRKLEKRILDLEAQVDSLVGELETKVDAKK